MKQIVTKVWGKRRIIEKRNKVQKERDKKAKLKLNAKENTSFQGRIKKGGVIKMLFTFYTFRGRDFMFLCLLVGFVFLQQLGSFSRYLNVWVLSKLGWCECSDCSSFFSERFQFLFVRHYHR